MPAAEPALLELPAEDNPLKFDAMDKQRKEKSLAPVEHYPYMDFWK